MCATVVTATPGCAATPAGAYTAPIPAALAAAIRCGIPGDARTSPLSEISPTNAVRSGVGTPLAAEARAAAMARSHAGSSTGSPAEEAPYSSLRAMRTPATSLKIASNTPIYNRMSDDMDLNCGTIIDGEETVEQAGARIFDEILATASGKLTRSEILGFGEEEFQPWLQGATL